MKTVTPDEARHIPSQPHRPGGVSFRHLLAGDDDAPDNYSLTVVSVTERYHTPQHRHNFEQVRYVLDGRFGFGPGAVQDAGTVGYFCEGTPYAQDAEGPSTTLLLQAGGASGHGYMGFERLQRGIEALRSRGEFHDGVFTWRDANGTKHNQDGYEAVWERVFGRPIEYPKPRYQAPVILQPARFAWLAVAGVRGVDRRSLGSFNERGLGIAQWRLAAGALVRFDAGLHRRLYYVEAGEVDAAGRRLPTGSAIELAPGESTVVTAGIGDARIFALRLPRFD